MPKRKDRDEAIEKAPSGSDWAHAVELLRYADFAEVGRALGGTASMVQKWYWGTNIGPDQVLRLEKLLGRKEKAAPTGERLDKIEGYLRLIARGVPVSAELLAELESAHHDATGAKRGRRQSGVARPKVDPRPPGT